MGIMPGQVKEVPPMLRRVEHEMMPLKIAGLNKITNEKIKRRHMSPYARPGRQTSDGSGTDLFVAGTLINNGALGVKKEDHEMLQEDLGVVALPSSQANPNSLMGPLEEAHLER